MQKENYGDVEYPYQYNQVNTGRPVKLPADWDISIS